MFGCRLRAGSHANRLLGRGSPRRLQLFKLLDQYGVFAFALAGLRLNGLQNGTQPVEQVQKPGDDGPIGDQFPIAQQAKKILARVGQLLEPLETKKSGGSLDRMYGAEDIA